MNIQVKVSVNVHVGFTRLARFWCMGCGDHFWGRAARILDGRAHCPHCGARNASPHVSEAIPVTVSDLYEPISELHKLSALARVVLGR